MKVGDQPKDVLEQNFKAIATRQNGTQVEIVIGNLESENNINTSIAGTYIFKIKHGNYVAEFQVVVELLVILFVVVFL